MAQIIEDYVSFEIAKLLKEKGFDGECRDYYSTEGHFYSEDFKSDWNHGGPETITIFSAPTIQMAMKWLRKEHNIFIDMHIQNNGHYIGYIYRTDGFALVGYDKRRESQFYKQACEAAIKYCLENLI